MAKVELPPGFQFDPTDEELVLYFLLPRVTSKPLPVQGLIQECDLYGDKHPWEIFEGPKSEKTAYFFTRLKKKTPKAKVAIRTVGDKVNGGGRWKLQAKGTSIKDDKGRIIGKSSSLSYECEGKCGYETEWGRWTMKEYALDGILSGSALPDLGDILLCRITNHQDNKRKTRQETGFGATSTTVCDQEPTHIESTAMDFPATDFEISQQQQQEDFGFQGINGFAMGDGCGMIRETNMEGHGVLSHEEALNLNPFFCVDDGFDIADFEEQNTQEFKITNPMVRLPVENQESTQPEKAHKGDSSQALLQCSFNDIEKPSAAQEPEIEHQVSTQQEQEYFDFDFDSDYFGGISLDDLEGAPWMDGLADPGGPLFVHGIESIYIPDLQEMGKTDKKKDQSRKRTRVFDQDDNAEKINNKKIRQEEEDEEAENGWFLL